MGMHLLRAIVVLALSSTAGAQSLADVARKETERRRTSPKATRTYTNTDLRPAPEPAPEGVPPAPSAPERDGQTEPGAAADAATQADVAADARERDSRPAPDADGTPDTGPRNREYWARRMKEARDEVSTGQVYLDSLQSRINALSMDFVNRDDPAQRSQIEMDRQRAVTERDRLQKAMEQRRRGIADLEEEARRAGVPPGWLR